MDENPQIIKPQPRRSNNPDFSLTAISPTGSNRSSFSTSQDLPPTSDPSTYTHTTPLAAPEPQTPTDVASDTLKPANGEGSKTSVPRTRSVLALTSSTLFGIYSPRGYEGSGRDDTPATPWGAGAETPARPSFSGTWSLSPDALQERIQAQSNPKAGIRGRQAPTYQHSRTKTTLKPRYIASVAIRVLVLFALGLAYGGLITRLSSRHPAVDLNTNPTTAPAVIPSADPLPWPQLFLWGILAIAIGGLLPLVDSRWTRSRPAQRAYRTASIPSPNTNGTNIVDKQHSPAPSPSPQPHRTTTAALGADWNPIVRSIGALVGIVFAVRRLPWHSSLQLSLTLTLVNPILWYLIDRTVSGLTLSSAIALLGSSLLTLFWPQFITLPDVHSISPFLFRASASLPSAAAGRLLRSAVVGVTGNASMAARRGTPTPFLESISARSGMGEGMLRVAGVDVLSYGTLAMVTWVSSVLFCSCICFGNVGRRLARGLRRGGAVAVSGLTEDQ